jgi:hypothetical protein
MPKSYVTVHAVVLLAITSSCRTPAPVAEVQPDRIVGCFRRQYADGPPGSAAGGSWYTVTSDAGATTILDVSPAQLDSAGGASRLDRSRVTVVLTPADSTVVKRAARVRAIRREPGTPC